MSIQKKPNGKWIARYRDASGGQRIAGKTGRGVSGGLMPSLAEVRRVFRLAVRETV
mgnify:CR=1 FL=1